MRPVPTEWDTVGYTADFVEEFAGPGLSASRWLPYHLPHWSSRGQAAARYRVPIDVREPHTYGVRWEPGRTACYVDRRCVRVVEQAPDYPMQLMLGVYDFAGERPGAEPSEAVQRLLVVHVLGHRRGRLAGPVPHARIAP